MIMLYSISLSKTAKSLECILRSSLGSLRRLKDRFSHVQARTNNARDKETQSGRSSAIQASFERHRGLQVLFLQPLPTPLHQCGFRI